MSEKKPKRLTYLGGLVIILDPDRDFIDFTDRDIFINELLAIEGLKEINGQLVNGLYVFTVEIDPEGPPIKQANDFREKIEAVWNKYVVKVPRGE